MTAAAATIAAVATPPGRGGIGVVRVSGPAVRMIAASLLGELPQPRYARYATFRDSQGSAIDRGIALFFPAPHSYTGEDVLELQGHGGDVVMQLLLAAVLDLGARQARPGEFTERAFLNDRIDLLQAEAIADLIDSSSAAAARGAVRSLQGDFSGQVNELLMALIELRVRIEGALDFPDEDIESLLGIRPYAAIDDLLNQLQTIRQQARQGQLLNTGIHIVISGEPNVGKSSLINRLTRQDTAIVTAIPGTTRDPISVHCLLDDLPVTLTDTAGLRDSTDTVEREGIRRANQALQQADLVLWMHDRPQAENALRQECRHILTAGIDMIHVHNKIDLEALEAYTTTDTQGLSTVGVSALNDSGIDRLIELIKQKVGYQPAGENDLVARERHLRALADTAHYLDQARLADEQTGELALVAENLRQAQQSLNTLTGEFSADDLLGEIFSRFCIGK